MLLHQRIVLGAQRLMRLGECGKLHLGRFALGQQNVKRVHAHCRMHCAFNVVKQESRPITRIVVGHPGFQVNVAHSQFRVIERRPLRFHYDSGLAGGQLAMHQRVVDAIGIQTQQRPAMKIAGLRSGTLP